ncbi:uncharacterized protein E5676_scaffold95G001140 [Cucumis melo var. makuwa]|uniref:Envelope-like protein n=1 Tax=Cucumis melo var. makuwa TaxID=1194695 RepID=A0A5A7TEG8_CUCMM|nr:uncharacterized protein E6C27_scaffold67G001860 [Cucumis melo var. makuwa]TYK27101.1 uncharacterized protein E5676_scaffold95G001140 [Cucumis melo var. makuwa]
MPSDISTSLLTPEMLTLVLTRGTVNMGLADGKLPAIFLSIKYSIIHKIGISNWYPSTHALITSTALAHLICLIGIGSHVDHPSILTNKIFLGLLQKTLTLRYRLFQGSHVPDIAHNIRPLRRVDQDHPTGTYMSNDGVAPFDLGHSNYASSQHRVTLSQWSYTISRDRPLEFIFYASKGE